MSSNKKISKRFFDEKIIDEIPNQNSNIKQEKKVTKLNKIKSKIKNYLKKFFPRRIKPTNQEKNKGPKI